MSKAPLRFKETDLVRAIRAVDKAGAAGRNKAVEILKNGVIRIVPALPVDPEKSERNPWD